MALMMNPERRQVPRMTVERLTYVTLEPGNGGIILDVSEGGLGFRSVLPIQRTGTIHLCLSEPNLQIEADAELAWNDEMREKGGLRFTSLSAEARQQIRNWINQPAMHLTAEHRYAPSLPSPRESPSVAASPPSTKTARDSSATPEVLSLTTNARRLLRGFSGGLATGLLVSAFFGAAFFLHAQRRQFGESLIQWGERLGARSRLQTVPAEPHTEPQEPRTASSRSAVSPAVPASHADQHVSQAALRGVAHAIPVRPVPVPIANAVPSPALPPASSSVIPIAPTPDAIPAVLASAPPTANFAANRIEASKETGIGLPSERYLEVGKFKERLWAYQTTEKLERFGFHAIVTQRGHLWMSSYYVLVGPYGNTREVEAAHKGLTSRGFKTRTIEKGSRNFELRSGLTLNGMPVPFGDCIISWESYVSDAVVKFEKIGSVVVTAEGKLVRGPVWYYTDAVVYRLDANGSRNLLEIRFGGTNQTLVFRKSW